jgi:hypothetical protein
MSLLNVDLDAGTLTKMCDACGATEVVQLAGLVLGDGVAGRVNPNAMRMPPCASCQAVETMLRTWDLTPLVDRDTGHCEQRAAKNALGKYLIAQGKQHPLAVPIHAAETDDPPEMMDLGDANDLRVPHSDRVAAHSAHNASVAGRAKSLSITFRER